ncbi:MAG TPA: dihydrofolate reductase family protein [Acidimicrobiia bacterium]|nr:dihydrofolate reductase family protein [Acidimicrobiia bacterium]
MRMGKVIYGMNVSLDGYIEDANGSIAFSEPDDDVHRHWSEQTRVASALLYGRRLFEVMEEHWTAASMRDDLPDVEAEFARAYVDTPRYVFSDTLESIPSGVEIVRSQEARAVVSRLKDATEGPLALGGAGLAASLLDIIDEFRMVVMPVVVGSGKPFFPAGSEFPLRLVDQHVFDSGTVYLRYVRR